MTPAADFPITRTRAFLQLLRPANVATAAADVLAGHAVAGVPSGAPLAWLLVSTTCLYAGGVVFNDVFDRALDATERPERPIPSGKISAATAGIVGAGLLTTGVLAAFGAGVASGAIGLGLAVAVLLYDARGKHLAVLGPVNMGLCRALNLILGLSASPAVLATMWPLGLVPWVYIAAVTMVSRGEVHGGRRRTASWALGLVMAVLAGLAGLGVTSDRARWAALFLAAVLAWRVLPPFWRAAQDPSPGASGTAVRAGVLSLVLVNAVIAAAYADIMSSLAVVLTGVLAVRLARRFAVT